MFSKFRREWLGVKNMYDRANWNNSKGKQQAIRTRERVSLFYVFIAWNLIGYTFYTLLKDKLPTDPVERRASLRHLTGSPGNLYVYKIQGLNIMDQYKFEYEEESEEEDDE